MPRAAIVFIAACASLPVCAWAAPRGVQKPAILVVPAQPSVDAAPAEAVVLRAGLHVIAFDPIRRQLENADSATLHHVDEILTAAQQAFLDQRFTDMVSLLEPLDDAALLVLGRPDRRAVLWDAQFDRGLAYLMRHAAGDLEHARERFLLALAIAPDRRPAHDIYGPGVETAFRDAVAERDRRTAHPVMLVGAPPDAQVIVDANPVLALTRPLVLRDGPHAVLARATGFSPTAWIADVHGATLAISLVPNHASAASDLAATWPGELADDTLLRLATATGADVVLVVDRTSDQHVRARVLGAAGSGRWEVRDTADAAATAALAWLGSNARIAPPETALVDKPVWRRPWVWASAAVVVGVVIVAIALSSRHAEDRIHVVAE